MRYLAFFAVLVALFVGSPCFGEQIRLDMSSLDKWKAETFPWAPRHSTYTVERIDGRDTIRIQSNNAGSGLDYLRVFQTYQTPILEWWWKAMNILAAGNAESRRGDDYPVRVYVKFPYDEKLLTFSLRLQYEFMKGILGYYPPSAVLNYVWANRTHAHNPILNAYSRQGAMFFADAGTDHLGSWRSHRVNIIDDFRAVFHRDPPPTFTLAIMGNSINTGGKTDAYIRDISVSSAAK